MRGRYSGYSLPELMMVMALLAILVMLGLRGLTSDRARASSEGMAAAVAAELDAARGKALSSRAPVAFCLPTAGGTVPDSQSFYLMEGQVQAASTTQRSFSGDFPGSSMAFVFWGSNSTLKRPDKAGGGAPDAVANWLGDRVGKDFALVFMPDGSVMSNDLPLVNGEYRLVVASGFSTVAATAPGSPGPMPVAPQNFRLLEVFAAHTISISPQGEIQVSTGIPEPEGVHVATGGLASNARPAQAAPPAPPAPTNPSIGAVAVYPKPFLEPKATVQQERNLSLTVEATDADGQPLFCTWRSKPVGSARGEGPFSLGDDHPMTWDAKRRRWVSQCTWAPPRASQVGDKYILTCTVRDSDNNEVSLSADVLNPVTVIPPGRILFETRRGNTDVAIINADGTGLRYLTDGPANDSWPSISPDGSRIAWLNYNGNSRGDIFLMNIDGSGVVRLTNNSADKFFTGWSSDGSKVIYGHNWPDRIYSINPDGTGEVELGTIQGSSCYQMVTTPDGRYLVNVSNIPGSGTSMVSGELIISEYAANGTSAPVIRDSTNVTNDSNARTSDGLPTFLPGSTNYRMVWARATPGPSGNYSDAIRELLMARIQDNGAGASPRFELADRQVLRTDGVSNLVFSPDAKKVLYLQSYPSQGIFVADWNDDGTNPPTMTNARRLTGLTGLETPYAWLR